MSAISINAISRDRFSDKSGESDDAEIVQKCLQGDRQSFRHLYQRHQQRVRSTLFQLCGNSALDDLVQDVFVRAWKGLPNFRKTAKFSTWLYRITWNVACDRRRHLAQANVQKQVLSNTAALQQDASDLMNLHYQDVVQRGLEVLSLDHRAVLVLHDLEDVPQKDIAQILNIPVGTVKSRLFHARDALRQFLHKEGVQL